MNLINHRGALAHAFTAAAVAAIFGFTVPASVAAPIFNELDSVEALQSRLLDLRDRMNGINAAARLEGRDLTADEDEAIRQVFAEFETTEARIEAVNAKELGPHATRAQFVAAAGATPGRKATPNAVQQRVQSTGSPQSAGTHRTGLLIHAGIKSPANELFGHEASQWAPGECFQAIANRMHDPRLTQGSTGVEGVGTDGGFSVPPDFYRGTVDQAMQAAEFAPRCRLFSAVSNVLTVPMVDKQDRREGGGLGACVLTGQVRRNNRRPGS